MTIQVMKRGLFARADEVVKGSRQATIRDVTILIQGVLILLATRKGTSPTASHRPTTEARDTQIVNFGDTQR
jgi:hypothetical protein